MRRLLLLGMVLLLSACSTKLSYHFLDWAIAWRMDDYVTLDEAQQQQFDKALQSFLYWHRKQELPRYSEDLKFLRSALQQGQLTPQLLSQFTDNARQHWLRIFSQTFDDIVPLVASFSDAQVQQIKNQLRQDEQKLQQKFQQQKTPAARIEAADEQLQDELTDWLGRLTDGQKQLIHQYNSQRLPVMSLWLDYRHEWYRRFNETLDKRHDSELLTQQLRLLLTAPETLRTAEFQQQLNENSQRLGQMLVQVAAVMNSKQQQHLQRKLDGLISDLDELSQE